MSYRDPLEAAQARIAQLEAQVAELLEASTKSEIERQNLQAELQIQKFDAERQIAELTQTAEIESLQAREMARSETVALEAKAKMLEAKVAALEAQLESAHMVIARLKEKR
jgi:hypothetical protein